MALQTKPIQLGVSAYLPMGRPQPLGAPPSGTRPRPTRPGGPTGINGGNPMLRSATGTGQARAVQPAASTIGALPPPPSGLPSPVATPASTSIGAAPAPAAPPPGGNSGMTFQVTAQGQQGLGHMGIPAPPTYTPRAPLAPLFNPFSQGGGAGGGGSQYVSATPQRDAAQAAVDRYTNGVQFVSNPVTQGSVHAGGIGGPSATAALNQWQLAQNNAQMLQSFGYRGEQMANNDYGPGGVNYQGPANQIGASANPQNPAPLQGSLGAGASTPSNGATGGGAGAAASTSGNPMFDALNNLATATDEQQRRAEEANEQRYRDILSGYGSAYDRQTGLLEGMGASERAGINRTFDALQGRNQQDAVSRGLAGTTILPGMRTLTERERTQAQGDLDERLRRERIGLDQQLTGDTLGFMERREDVAPNMSDLINLATALGNAGDNSQPVQPAYIPDYGGYGSPYEPSYIGYGGGGGGFGGFGGGGVYGGMGNLNDALLMQAMLAGGGGGGSSYMDRQRAAQAASPAQRDPLRYVGINDLQMPLNAVDVDPRRLAQFSSYV